MLNRSGLPFGCACTPALAGWEGELLGHWLFGKLHSGHSSEGGFASRLSEGAGLTCSRDAERLERCSCDSPSCCADVTAPSLLLGLGMLCSWMCWRRAQGGD